MKQSASISYTFGASILLILTFACAPPRRSQLKARLDLERPPPTFFKPPVASPMILSRFGKRGRTFHTGIDVRTKGGRSLDVMAVAAGRVMKAGKTAGYGNRVEIVHAGGYRTLCAHLKKCLVKKGEWVKSGQVIGIMGRTGRATAIHLHFEVIDPKGNFLNPESIFK